MGASVRPDQDLDAIIAARRAALSPSTPAAVAPGQSAPYVKNGHPVVDTSSRDAAGHVPTHRLDQATNRSPDESFPQYESRVLAQRTWSPDTAARSDLASLDPAVADSARSLLAHAKQSGVQLGVGETRRTQERQEMLFQKGRATPGSPVTWTLTSDHTPGRAIDFTGAPESLAWLQQNAPKHGFSVMGSMDPGHVSLPSTAPTQDLDSVIAARRAALTAPSSGNVDLRAPATPAPRSRFQSVPTMAESTSSRLGSAPPRTDGLGGAAAAVVRGLSQGATLGFADELASGIDTIKDKITGGGGTYAQHLAENRARLADSRSQHPIASLAGEIGGIAATGRVLPGVAVGSGLARTMLEGATFGGIAGAGNAEGDLSDRARGAAIGAVGGAATGGVVHGASKVLAPVGSALASALHLRAPSAAADVAAGGLERAPTFTNRIAQGAGVRDVDTYANDVISKAVTKGGKNFSDIRTAAETASPDKPIILADLAGEGAQGLAAGARGIPGSGARTTIPATLKGRLGSQAPRVAADLTQASGVEPINPFELAQQMKAAKLQEANQLYPAAHAHGPVDDPELLKLLERPYVQDHWKDAQKIAGAEGKTLPTLTRSVEHPIIFDGTPLTFPDGTPRTYTAEEKVKLPTAQTLHYVKRALDDAVTAAYNRGGKSSALGHALETARDEFTGRLYQSVPAYAKADAAYSSASRLEDALQAGRAAATKDPRAVDLELQALKSPEEQRLYRAGLQDAQTTTMASTNKASSILPRDEHDVWRQRRLGQVATDPAAAGELARRSQEERTMLDTKEKILGGSNTAEKSSAQGEIAGAPSGAGRALASAALGHPAAAIRFGLKSQVGNLVKVTTAENADAIAAKLMAGAKSREELLQTIDELNAHAARATSATQRNVLRRMAESMAGTAAGELASTRH